MMRSLPSLLSCCLWLMLAVVTSVCADDPPAGRSYEGGATPTLVPGIRGQAVLIGAKRATPVYALPAGTTVRRGTVEFWFSPEDWDNRMIYDLQGTQRFVPLIRGVRTDPASGEGVTLFALGVFRMSESKAGAPDNLWVRYPVYPGQWYHVMIVWEEGRYRVFVNGEAADDWTFRLIAGPAAEADAPLSRLEFGGGRWWTEFRRISGHMNYSGQETRIDQFRYYARALTGPEIANAYRRYLPGAELKPLPFADATIQMNNHTRRIAVAVELLGPERDRVTGVHLKLTGADGAVVADTALPPIENGRAATQLTHDADLYGTFTGHLRFTDAAGEEVATQELVVERPAPSWYGNTLGIHDGEVLPGWTPLTRDGSLIRALHKEIELDARGWPVRLAATGSDVLDAPVLLTLVSGAGPVALAPVGTAPEFLSERPDLIESRGVAAADGWRLTTTIATEFDGFMLVEAVLDGPAESTVRQFQIEFPLRLAPEQFVGFWAGNPWFRAACDYRRLPADEGVVFRSNGTGRAQPDGWKEKVSFLPFVSIADDWRGLFWLAENDRNWSQSWERPAQEIVREGDRTWLRLNLVHDAAPKAMTGPRTYRFAIQTMPVKPVAPNARALAKKVSFGAVDGFNGHTITADFGGHMDFRIDPQGGDWSIVERKAPAGRKASPSRELYMYLDRNWQRAPEDAIEYQRDWRGWGGATHYSPVVRDAYAWYLNEFLRRGHIQGIYIDDCWTKPTKGHAPSYRHENGEPEWGFAFYDYRTMLKRIRWLFVDNGVDPLIWGHTTQTLYYPVFAFMDIMVDGEDRFVPWGEKRDFISSWGVDRIRYSNVVKSGIPTVWMNAIGNKLEPKGPMAKWHYRQQRAYIGLCAAVDVWPIDDACGRFRADLAALGCADDSAQFVGFWEPANPLSTEVPAIHGSVYRLPDHLAVVILNAGPTEQVPEIAIDEAAVRAWLGDGTLTIVDADNQSLPEAEDIQDYIAEAAAVVPTTKVDGDEGDAVAEAVMADLAETVAEEDRLANDPLATYGDHNLTYEAGVLRLRVRAHDYRLLKLTVAPGGQP